MLDEIEEEVKLGGYIIDWHACDLFPKSWIDLVVVLRVNSTILYDRLKLRYPPIPSPPIQPSPAHITNRAARRNYPELKLQENLDSEIMEVLLQEARDSYDEEIVVELTSNTSEEVDSNVARIEAWVAQWMKDNEGAEKEDS